MTAYFSGLLAMFMTKIRQPSRHTFTRFQSFRMFEILELVAPEFCYLTSSSPPRRLFFRSVLFSLLPSTHHRCTTFSVYYFEYQISFTKTSSVYCFLMFCIFFIITINLSLRSREVVGGKRQKKFK